MYVPHATVVPTPRLRKDRLYSCLFSGSSCRGVKTIRGILIKVSDCEECRPRDTGAEV